MSAVPFRAFEVDAAAELRDRLMRERFFDARLCVLSLVTQRSILIDPLLHSSPRAFSTLMRMVTDGARFALAREPLSQVIACVRFIISDRARAAQQRCADRFFFEC